MEKFELDQYYFLGIRTPIDLDSIYEDGMTFDELEERVHEYILEQQIIGYHESAKLIFTFDPSLRTSLELAHEAGFLTLKGLNSEFLAMVLFHQILWDDWAEIRDDVKYEVYKELKNKKN